MPETMPERIKGALKAAGLTVQGLAEEWGINRPAFSTRINSGEMDEAELVRIADRTGTNAPYLRYGIRGDFRDGVRWAVQHLRGQLDHLATHVGTQTAAPDAGAAAKVADDEKYRGPTAPGAAQRKPAGGRSR